MGLIVICLFFGFFCGLSLCYDSFCKKDRCFVCAGKYCTTTCQGDHCYRCPIGDCCDEEQCNVCRGKKCCQQNSCNTCVKHCLKTCTSDNGRCHENCLTDCTTTKLVQPGRSMIYNTLVQVNVGYQSSNVVTNQNTVNVPIFINTKTINTINGGEITGTPDDITTISATEATGSATLIMRRISTEPITTEAPTTKPALCCQIVHPKIEYDMVTIKKVMIRKHKECSDLCHSEYMHIIETKVDNGCVTIISEPYKYCGNFKIIDCEICYECPGMTVIQCKNQPTCPKDCSDGIYEEDFYNKFH